MWYFELQLDNDESKYKTAVYQGTLTKTYYSILKFTIVTTENFTMWKVFFLQNLNPFKFFLAFENPQSFSLFLQLIYMVEY